MSLQFRARRLLWAVLTVAFLAVCLGNSPVNAHAELEAGRGTLAEGKQDVRRVLPASASSTIADVTAGPEAQRPQGSDAAPLDSSQSADSLPNPGPLADQKWPVRLLVTGTLHPGDTYAFVAGRGIARLSSGDTLRVFYPGATGWLETELTVAKTALSSGSVMTNNWILSGGIVYFTSKPPVLLPQGTVMVSDARGQTPWLPPPLWGTWDSAGSTLRAAYAERNRFYVNQWPSNSRPLQREDRIIINPGEPNEDTLSVVYVDRKVDPETGESFILVTTSDRPTLAHFAGEPVRRLLPFGAGGGNQAPPAASPPPAAAPDNEPPTAPADAPAADPDPTDGTPAPKETPAAPQPPATGTGVRDERAGKSAMVLGFMLIAGALAAAAVAGVGSRRHPE